MQEQRAALQASQQATWKDDVAKDTSGVSRKGYTAVGLTLGIFVAWAVLFPLAGAVVATGKVITVGQNKLLQHPAGGVVRLIVSKEGEFLEKGDLVAVIEPATALAELAELSARKDLLLARKTRLDASKSGSAGFIIPKPSLLPMAEMRGAKTVGTNKTNTLVFNEQQAEFTAGSNRFQSEISALESQVASLESEYTSVDRQIKQRRSRLALLSNQYNKIAPLAAEGHVAKTQLWEIEANKLEASAQVAALEGNLDSLVSRIEEARSRKDTLNATRNQETSRELTEVLSELASIEERISAAQKMVEYAEIRTPVAGTLTNLSIHTTGGVVDAGATIAEVVPSSSPLEVEARILPADVGSISLDQEANVVVTAFNSRLVDPFDGKVTYVAADSQLDQQTGEPYFLARIAVSPENPSAKSIQSGMYAQVFIETESRSFMSYVMRPVTDSFRKAFNER